MNNPIVKKNINDPVSCLYSNNNGSYIFYSSTSGKLYQSVDNGNNFTQIQNFDNRNSVPNYIVGSRSGDVIFLMAQGNNNPYINIYSNSGENLSDTYELPQETYLKPAVPFITANYFFITDSQLRLYIFQIENYRFSTPQVFNIPSLESVSSINVDSDNQNLIIFGSKSGYTETQIYNYIAQQFNKGGPIERLEYPLNYYFLNTGASDISIFTKLDTLNPVTQFTINTSDDYFKTNNFNFYNGKPNVSGNPGNGMTVSSYVGNLLFSSNNYGIILFEKNQSYNYLPRKNIVNSYISGNGRWIYAYESSGVFYTFDTQLGPYDPPHNDPQDSDTGLIIGLVCGIIAILVVTFLIVFYLYKKK